MAISPGDLDINLLRALEALLEERNVTNAGRRLSLSQPTVSGILARLRRHFGDQLLVREGRDLELTPFAYRLLPMVQETMQQIRATMAMSTQFRPAECTQRFSVVMSDYAMTVLAQPLIKVLSSRAPKVRIDFKPLVGGDYEDESYVRRHDFVITPLGFEVRGHSRPVITDRFVCIADANNPHVHPGWPTREDLARLPQAVGTFGKRPTHVLRQLELHGIHPRVHATVNGFNTLPFLVSGTELVALVPELLAIRFRPLLGLVVRETPFSEVPFVDALHWHRSRSDDLGHRWLRNVILQIGERFSSAPRQEQAN